MTPRSHIDPTTSGRRPRRRRRPAARLGLLVAALLVLVACAPGTGPASVAPPELRLVPDETRLLRLDPTGVGSGAVVIGFVVEVANPNAFEVRLARLRGDLELGGRRVADVDVAGGLAIPAQGTSRLDLETAIPLETVPGLLDDLAGLFAGRPLDFALSATASLDVFGVAAPLPRTTLLFGEIPPVDFAAPVLRFDAGASGLVELTPFRGTVVVAFEVDNPGPIGYRVTSPSVEVRVGSTPIASTGLGSVGVPAFGSQSAQLRVDFNPVTLGVAAVQLLQDLADGRAGAELVVRGRLLLEVPGLGVVELDPGTVLRGRLD